ncbi:MAG TPA: hypothetical protein DHV62_09405 [Elusimicrobia bacterium]|jgi:beta-lactamase class A|nr:hypothetical protein [Elusimicrobiota bacterium]
MVQQKLQNKFIFFIFLIFILSGITYYVHSSHRNGQKKIENIEYIDANWQTLAEKIKNKLYNFPGNVGLVIKDLKTGKTIFYNQDKLFPSASLVKIAIMSACFQAESEGKINFNDYFRLKSKYKSRGSGILRYSPAGKKISLKELVELMITKSDNTATNILTEILSFDYLNGYFQQMGLRNTNFSRNIMDITKYYRGIENYTTASDIAQILDKIYHYQLVSPEASERMLTLLKKQEIRDRLPRYLPGYVEVAHKTGLFDNVCHDAGIIFHPRGDFLISILVSDHQEHRLAKELIGQVAKIAFEYYENRTLHISN